MNLKLSTHFGLDEFVISEVGERRGIDNTPSAATIKNLRTTAIYLELVRGYLFNHPLHITSGYRCPDLNAAVGGAADSAHMAGFAADFICPTYGAPLDVCKLLHAHLNETPIDQLIWEFSWVHISFMSNPRAQLLIRDKNGAHQVKFFPNEVPVA